MRSKKALFRFAVVAALDGLLLTAVAGCDKGPTQPSRTDLQVRSQQTTPPSQPTLLTITVSGNARLANPGDTTQLTAVARYSDGTTRDVTKEANWGPPGARLFILTQGSLTAIEYGTEDVVVSLPSGGPIAKIGIRVQPEGMFFLTGRVTEQGGFTIADAIVRVTSGSLTFTAKTSILGYVLPAAGDTIVTVEKDAFTTDTKRLVVQGDQEVNVELQRADRAAFAGVYMLTLTGSASCATLPPEARRRQYYARISEGTDSSVIVDLSSPNFMPFVDAGFTGTRDGNHLRFNLAEGPRSRYAILELLDDDRVLSYAGTADGAIEGTTIAATLDGTVSVTSLTDAASSVIASCKASDHRLEFVRVGT